MRERPIIFSAPMVCAILEGRKTHTRRVIKPQPRLNWAYRLTAEFKTVQVSTMGVHDRVFIKCPYGQVGDRLWVREAFCETDWKPGTSGFPADPATGFIIAYRADYPDWPTRPFPAPWDPNWKPSIFMPHWASRITLEIAGIRVERVQEISEQDCLAEGIQIPVEKVQDPPVIGLLRLTGQYPPGSYMDIGPEAASKEHKWLRAHHASLWDSHNAKRGFGWAANPWVWVIEFKRITECAA